VFCSHSLCDSSNSIIVSTIFFVFLHVFLKKMDVHIIIFSFQFGGNKNNGMITNTGTLESSSAKFGSVEFS